MNSKTKMALSFVAFLIAAAAAYVMYDLGLRKVDSTDLVERYVDSISNYGRFSWKEYFVLYDMDIFWTVPAPMPVSRRRHHRNGAVGPPKPEALINPTADRRTREVGNFAPALLGKFDPAFTRANPLVLPGASRFARCREAVAKA